VLCGLGVWLDRRFLFVAGLLLVCLVGLVKPVEGIPPVTMTPSPSTVTVTVGASGSTTVTVTPPDGFGLTLLDSVVSCPSGLPAGASCSTNPSPLPNPFSVPSPNGAQFTLMVSTSASTPPGSYTVTVQLSFNLQAEMIQPILSDNTFFPLTPGSGGGIGPSSVTLQQGTQFSGTTSITLSVSPFTTGTTVSCSKPAVDVSGSTGSCTATVSGASGSISGETITFSQSGGTGSISFPSGTSCNLSGSSCSVTVAGSAAGGVTVQASYPGDAINAASSGTAGLVVNSMLVAPTISPTQATITQDQSVTLTSTPVTTGTPPYKYQWFEKAPSASSYSPIQGATSTSYTFTPNSGTQTGTWMFEVKVTDSDPVTVTSSPVTVTVNPAPAPPIPEYPYGLSLLAAFMLVGYTLLKRRTKNRNYL